MKWIFRLILALVVLVALAWVALVLLGPRLLDKQLMDRLAGQITAEAVDMSWGGQVTLSDVTLTLPDAPRMTLTRLALRPVWHDKGVGLQLDGSNLTIAATQSSITTIQGMFYPKSRDQIIGPFDLTLTDLAFPVGSVATAQLTGHVDVQAQELTDLRFDSTVLDVEGGTPQGGIDLAIDQVILIADRVTPAFVAPIVVEASGVTGDVLQGPARLWVAGLKDAKITLDTLAMPLQSDPVQLVMRAQTTAPTDPALIAWIETETDLTLIRGPECRDVFCARGLAALTSKNMWEVAAGEESTRGGFTCAALPCFPGSLSFDPVEVTDVQAFATDLGRTRTLSPFVLGFVAAELSKVARPQD